MKKSVQTIALSLLTALAVSFAVQIPRVEAYVHWLASFTASPQTWTSAFESNPTATDPVSQADDHLRQIKAEVRDRVETEMDFGSGIGLVGTDTGRLLPGAARAFVQSGRPTVDGTLTPNCLSEADRNGNRGCDAGRLSLDTADNSLAVALDAGADGDADSWQRIKIDAADVTSGQFANARISQSSVVQWATNDYVKLQSQIGGSPAQFNNLNTLGSFSAFEVRLNFVPSANATVVLQVSTNNCSSMITSSSYSFAVNSTKASTGASVVSSTTLGTSITLTPSFSVSAGDNISATVRVNNLGSGAGSATFITDFDVAYGGIAGANDMIITRGGGILNGNSTVNCIRIGPDTGAATGLTAALYGARI